MRIDQPLVVDVARENLLSAIKTKEKDVNSRFLKVKLVNKGVPLTVGANERLILGGRRADGLVKGYEGVLENNVVTFDISWFIELNGVVDAEITLINTTTQEKLSSFPFPILVEESIYTDEEIIKDPNYDLLLSLITDVETIKKEIEDALAKGDFNGATFIPKVSNEGIISWTNDKGLPNPPDTDIKGKSAYQIAVDNGFVGTEQEWLDSLKASGTLLGRLALAVGKGITSDPEPSVIIQKLDNSFDQGQLVYLTDELGQTFYTPLRCISFDNIAIFYNIKSVSNTKIQIELINLDGNTERATREIKEYDIPKINDNATNSAETWSSYKITEELNRPQHNTMRITATKNPLGSGYISDYSSSEIKNWVDAGGDAELYFEDTIEGSGEQIYHYIKFQNRTAYFRRNVLTEGEVRQIDIEIYERNIKFTDLKQQFATPDDIQMLEDSKANYTHKVIASDKVSQLDALEILNDLQTYDGKLIEFLTNGENPSKAVATGRVFTTTQGDAYLITYNLDGTTTIWNKDNYEKHQIETSSLINAGLVDVDNLTVDVQGDAPHLYSVRDAMNTPNGIKGDGCVFVLPHSLNKQIQYYTDMTSGKQWYRLVTGEPDAHSFDIWKEMGGSSGSEVWENIDLTAITPSGMFTSAYDENSNTIINTLNQETSTFDFIFNKNYKKLKITVLSEVTQPTSFSVQTLVSLKPINTETGEEVETTIQIGDPITIYNSSKRKIIYEIEKVEDVTATNLFKVKSLSSDTPNLYEGGIATIVTDFNKTLYSESRKDNSFKLNEICFSSLVPTSNILKIGSTFSIKGVVE